MNNITALTLRFLAIFSIALLTLGLFDTNPAMMILVYAMIMTLISWYGQQFFLQAVDRGIGALIQSLLAGGLAWIMAQALANFRVTFATLVAFVLLICFTQYYFNKTPTR